MHPYDFIEVDKVRGMTTFIKFVDLLDWLARQSDLACRTLCEVMALDDELTIHRNQRWRDVILDPIVWYLPPFLAGTASFYPDESQLARMIVLRRYAVGGFYGLNGGLSFILSHLAASVVRMSVPSSVISAVSVSAISFCGILALALLIYSVKSRARLGWKRFAFLSTLVGICIGVLV